MSAAPSLSRVAQASTASETSLIELCIAGDLSAFDELVAAHQDRIFSLCYWMLGHREDARDAAQDAFVRAFRSLSKFRHDSSFGTWIHRIAVNVCFDALARRKRTPTPYADLGTDECEPDSDVLSRQHTREADDSSEEPASTLFARERRHAVRNALAQIPEHYRVALVLFDIEGCSYEEIAHNMDLPLGTVKSRINRARLALREHLESRRELFED